MHVLRTARLSDIPSLVELAHTGNYINLPPFDERVREIVESSVACFESAAQSETPPAMHERWRDRYVFVVDDGEGRCVGTSAIRGGMGNAEHPNLSFQLFKIVRRSGVLRKEDEGTPIVSGEVEHIYATLFQDVLSPSELGGNVMHPNLRAMGLGKLASYARFHYLRVHSAWFSNRLLAEMMAPIDPYNDGNPFWRQVVRPFIGLSYENADRLSTHDEQREFMYTMLPRLVNLSLLSGRVLDSIGETGPYTKGAEGMLRAIGFADSTRIDPFDGGTHLETRLSEVVELRGEPHTVRVGAAPGVEDLMVSVEHGSEFRAVRCRGSIGDGVVDIDEETARTLDAASGDEVRVSPLKFEPMPQRKRGSGVPTINVAEIRAERGTARGTHMTLGEFAGIVEDELDGILQSLRDMG